MAGIHAPRQRPWPCILGVASAPDSHSPTVLLVDHDLARLAVTRGLLEREGHPVVVARDAAMGVAVADASIGVIVLADELPLVPARRLIGTVRERNAAMQVVLYASPRSGELCRETLERMGVHTYVREGDGADRLLGAVDAAMRTYVQVSQAQASDRLKMELLASVSHEFRSPLNIVLGYLELAAEGAFGTYSEALSEALGKVSWNAGHLLELVEDFLDLAKLESSTIEVEKVDVGALVGALVRDHELIVQERPISLRADVQGQLPPVLAEGPKLRVIVQNLLSNALKFTERGEIVVTAEAPMAGVVQVHVRDTGPGIPPEACGAVFDLYRQLGPGDLRTKGIGLGLALARRFACAMGGDLTVKSTVGVGSTFTLTLPAADAGAPALNFVLH